MNKFCIFACWILFAGHSSISLAGPAELILEGYKRKAKQMSASFTEFSSERGRLIYEQKHSSKLGEISCASCHGSDPRKSGRTLTNKEIEPMAPAVNPNRFTDSAKTEKWFIRNCDDVLGRECTAMEKGDFLAFMLSFK